MIDKEHKVVRFVAEYCEQTEFRTARYDLASFDLPSFQEEFGEWDKSSPMFHCYEVAEGNLPFLKRHLRNEPHWDFERYSYFVEACAYNPTLEVTGVNAGTST